ncbi:MAG: class I SAM-dependent methyltransferase [Actinomycetia bacterium]|nr:class I SAM-dependent methyltransferase [Actinomycetes bacterium]
MTTTPLRKVDGTENASWDLASSVGVTATMVAAGRRSSINPRGPRRASAPFAEPSVRAVGMEFFTRLLDGEFGPAALDDGALARLPAMIDEMALRTRFFDAAFLAVGASEVRQAVILASGLDARAYRLAWPAGRTVVYEIDQPHVIASTTTAVAGIGAERRAVSIDLREDWPAALRSAGFDVAAPTAWSAEGLLPFLPSEAQDRLFDDITDLSAPGSTIATEYVPGLQDIDEETARAPMTWLRSPVGHKENASKSGPCFRYMTSAGWQAAQELAEDEHLARNGIERIVVNDDAAFANLTYVNATLKS